MTTITINGTVTFDESSSLQNTGVSVPGEDNNDQDVLLSVLQSEAPAFYSSLFDATELNLSTTFANACGVDRECDGFITVSGSGAFTSLGFVNGTARAPL
jgi:hypothetical protein